MQRYFIDQEQMVADPIHLTGDDYHHLKHVMRARVNDAIICCDGQGHDYHVRIEAIDDQSIQGRVVEKTPSIGEPKCQVTIAQSLPKGDKWEWVLQKGTEIGANGFLPFVSERTIVKIPPKKVERKRERWQKIVKEAAEQAHRGKIPPVESVHSWQQLLQRFSSFDQVCLAYEAGGEPFSSFLATYSGSSLLVVVGPEGGFSAHEVEAAKEQGAVPITLGPRILRTETAPLVMLTSIFFAGGELT